MLSKSLGKTSGNVYKTIITLYTIGVYHTRPENTISRYSLVSSIIRIIGTCNMFLACNNIINFLYEVLYSKLLVYFIRKIKVTFFRQVSKDNNAVYIELLVISEVTINLIILEGILLFLLNVSILLFILEVLSSVSLYSV